MMTRRAIPVLLASVAVVAGCSKSTVESYRIPKEPAAQAQTPHQHSASPAAGGGGTAASSDDSAMANTAVATASGAALTWTAPPHWTAKPASSMRKGSYTISGDGGGGEAELAITAFPGDVGGDFANLNRWRGQIQLPPISEAEFPAAILRQERNGVKMTVVDIVGTGTSARRILGAMVPHGGATWFFKMDGPDAVVAKEKAAFMALLDTVKPAASAQ
jgi:hypothetical protein